MSKYRKIQQQVKAPQLEKMPRHYSYSSKTRTLVLNGHTYVNVGGDFMNIVNGG